MLINTLHLEQLEDYPLRVCPEHHRIEVSQSGEQGMWC